MAELGGLRTAVQSVADKLANLKAVIEGLQTSTVVQDQIDEIQASVDEIGTTIDQIVAELQGTDVPATGETPPA